MRITNLGHASFLIEDDELKIIFDPYQDDSVPGLEFPKGIEANYVFCSHDHFDHNASELVKIIPTDNHLKAKDIVFPHDKQNGAKRGLSTAKILYFSDYSVAHLGDIGDISNLQLISQLKDADVILCPINGYFTISAEEAFKLHRLLPNALIVPMHYEDEKHQFGYPDGGQIQIFKKLFPNYLEVKETVNISKEMFSYDALIFTDFVQGERK